MIKMMIAVILAPVALGAAALTVAIGIGLVKAIFTKK